MPTETAEQYLKYHMEQRKGYTFYFLMLLELLYFENGKSRLPAVLLALVQIFF